MYMSYSNGKLPEETISHGKIVEIVKGLPGVGFKLTDDGDYDIQNKKLRNVASPQTNNDATTKIYVDTEVDKTLKLDSSNKMLGVLDMDNRRIENVAPARHGFSDAVSSLHLHTFFFDLNTNDGKIEAQNPIDMKNEKISNLAEGIDNSDAITKHQLETGLAPKADKTELASYLKKDGSVALTNNLDLGDNEIVNVKEATSGSHAVNLSQLNSELSKYLHKTGGDMTGDIRMDNNSIYEIKNVENDTSAVNRKYVNDELDKKLDKNKDFSMGNNKITSLRNPDDSNELVNKSYVDQKVSQAGGSVDLTPYLKRDGTVSVTGKFDFGDNIITKIGNGTQSTDVVNKGYIDTELFAKPNVNQVVLRDGSQDMAGNLNMSLNKIIDCGQPTGTRDVTNKAYVDFEVGKKPDTNSVLLRDGSQNMTGNLNMSQKKIVNLADLTGINDATGKGYVDRLFLDSLRLDGSSKMTGNLDMNNQQIKNVKDATHNQDAITLKQVNDAIATTSTNNDKYTDQKIAESHISTHENRKNVLAYAMDDGEFTEDAGIQDVNLIDFNDMPHKTNKKSVFYEGSENK